MLPHQESEGGVAARAQCGPSPGPVRKNRAGRSQLTPRTGRAAKSSTGEILPSEQGERTR